MSTRLLCNSFSLSDAGGHVCTNGHAFINCHGYKLILYSTGSTALTDWEINLRTARPFLSGGLGSGCLVLMGEHTRVDCVTNQVNLRWI